MSWKKVACRKKGSRNPCHGDRSDSTRLIKGVKQSEVEVLLSSVCTDGGWNPIGSEAGTCGEKKSPRGTRAHDPNERNRRVTKEENERG